MYIAVEATFNPNSDYFFPKKPIKITSVVCNE